VTGTLRTLRRRRWRPLAIALTAVAASSATAQHATPTAGPAERAGQALDRAWSSVTTEVSEALLASRVRIALLEHLKQDGLGIHIEIRGEAVTLTGRVSNRSSLELAVEVARSVEGVRAVKSGIELELEQESAGRPQAGVLGSVEQEVRDALLEARVKVRLIDQLGRVAFAIEVEATDGIVSLSGTAPDTTRRELARDIAGSTKGVVEVHDVMR
jgi:hyperosmotically inducible periplasmic protein